MEIALEENRRNNNKCSKSCRGSSMTCTKSLYLTVLGGMEERDVEGICAGHDRAWALYFPGNITPGLRKPSSKAQRMHKRPQNETPIFQHQLQLLRTQNRHTHLQRLSYLASLQISNHNVNFYCFCTISSDHHHLYQIPPPSVKI